MPAVKKDLRALARTYTDSSVRTLVGIMTNEKAPAAARVTAASVVLDRGWGKAHQPGSMTHDVGDNAKAIWEAIAKRHAGTDD